MTVKAYIYAEDGALLGFLAYTEEPPDVLELEGRYFQRDKCVSMEMEDRDIIGILSFDYLEIEVVPNMPVIQVCMGCGRNASPTWWKCCAEHVSEDGPDVYCQSCVEHLHFGELEFQRE